GEVSPSRSHTGPPSPRRSGCVPGWVALSLDRRPDPERRSIMGFSSWLANRNPSPAATRGRTPSAPRNRPSFRLRLQALEGRWLPSTLTVPTTADSGPGSLRAEITAAKNNTTIIFDPSRVDFQTITLTSGELDIYGPYTDGGGNSFS